MKVTEKSRVSLVGHPFAPIGMGEHVRCTFRALRSVGVRAELVDIYGLNLPDAEVREELSSYVYSDLGSINIFHINGDEVVQARTHLQKRSNKAKYNIIYPAWELSRYPDEWAKQLDRFDEIWAPSKFIHEALVRTCKRPVLLMPLACEVAITSFLSRRYFSIPEPDYAFLFFFDLRSYSTRKNCGAVIDAFRKLLMKRSGAQACLVLKVNSGEHDREALERIRAYVGNMRDRVIIIDRIMSDNEIKNLVRCCDSFVSLHRSEGYGRGISEAMYLGKPVIATDYSGNVDFMAHDKSLAVAFRLVPVAEHSYPHWENQVWAEPDVEQASDHMVKLIDDPQYGRDIGARASLHIRTEFGYRVIGQRYLQRLDEIEKNLTDHVSVIEPLRREV